GHALGISELPTERPQALEELVVNWERGGIAALPPRGGARHALRQPHEVDEAGAAALVTRLGARLHGLVEVRDEVPVPAARIVGELEHRPGLVARRPPDGGVVDALLEPLVADDVGPRVEEDTVAREPVA